MQYRLRTPLILLALGPPMLWGGWMLGGVLTKEPEVDLWYIDCAKDYVPPPGFNLRQEAARQKAIEAEARRAQ